MYSIGWISFALSIIGLALNTRKIIWCWPIWVVGSITWLIYAFSNNDWPFFTSQIVYLFFNIYGWYKWHKLEVVMPKEFTDCVADLKSQGKSADSAYAICTAQYIKKHGKSPFANEEIAHLPISEQAKQSIREMSTGQRKVKAISEITKVG